MGFENRKSARVKTDINLCYWAGGGAVGAANWGQAINLSGTGMAFHSGKDMAAGELALLEFSLPGKHKPMRLFAQVISTAKEAGVEPRWQIRVRFQGVEGEEDMLLKQYILQVSDPKLAAVTGWGKAYFSGMDPLETKYRELAAAEHKLRMDEKSFITAKEINYLKNFQAHLERHLGARIPSNFRLLGSKGLKEQGLAWLELSLHSGHLHILANVLWCNQEDEKSEAGLSLCAVQKDEAVRLEKGV